MGFQLGGFLAGVSDAAVDRMQRVEDERISLNVGDVVGIHGIYESLTTAAASAPTIIFTQLTGPSANVRDLLVGENFKGANSGAVATVAEIISDTEIAFIPKNDLGFTEGETVSFGETGVQGVVSTLDTTSTNITSNFKLIVLSLLFILIAIYENWLFTLS